MAGGMLPERDVATHESGFDFREFLRAEILLAEQPIHRPGADSREERALRIDPGIVDIGCLLFDRSAAGLETRIARRGIIMMDPSGFESGPVARAQEHGTRRDHVR